MHAAYAYFSNCITGYLKLLTNPWISPTHLLVKDKIYAHLLVTAKKMLANGMQAVNISM